MAQGVVMPKAGISVESCIIGSWRKNVGDAVAVGDVLFDYETDKAAFECESTAAGTLLAVLYGPGEEVPVLTNVCVIGEPGEDIGALTPAAGPAAETPAETPAESTPSVSPAAAAVPAQPQTGVSPRARNLAQRLNVDLSSAGGTGPRGRVIERDVQALSAMPQAKAEPPATAAAPQAPRTSAPSSLPYTDGKMPRIRQNISKAMYASLQNTAQLTHHHSFDASAVLDMRARFKKSGESSGLFGITIGDMVLYAAVRTLMHNKFLNAHLLEGDVIRTFEGVHIGVAADTPRGLMVPTVFDADQLSLAELSAKVKELAAICRSGAVNPDLLQGGTFTVSNLGSTGVEIFTPILNPPQVGILGVCGVVQRPRQTDDGIRLYPAIGLSLTYDHRAVDGAPASRFMQQLCANLENFPILLAL